MAWSKRFSEAAPQRVNKWLAQQGVCSRREAEALIADGLVFVDARQVTDPGHKIEPGQTLILKDEARGAHVSVLIHKPVGLVSAQPEAGQIPAARLLRRENLWGGDAAVPGPKHKLAPLGRLDQDSRGLLILSDDGVLAKALIGPASQLDKEYLVRVTGKLDDDKLALLRHGLELDGRKLKHAQVRQIGAQRLSFILREGRNRQIRRMCALVGLDVVDLYRVRIGPLELGDLPEGKWRTLSAGEREGLVRASSQRNGD
jgi:23S rRNA pseudouridine2604 synthase